MCHSIYLDAPAPVKKQFDLLCLEVELAMEELDNIDLSNVAINDDVDLTNTINFLIKQTEVCEKHLSDLNYLNKRATKYGPKSGR